MYKKIEKSDADDVLNIENSKEDNDNSEEEHEIYYNIEHISLNLENLK